MDWVETANGVNKSIISFGIARLVTQQTDAAAIQRNFTDYEDQEAAASNFLLRILARQRQAAFAFWEELPPPERTSVHMEGFNKLRAATDGLLLNYLGFIVPGIKPANARLVSAAIRDTGPVWATAILPADRPIILATLSKAESAIKDDETRKNLSSSKRC
jgi:hypothetical protein